jgi:hypothetical protein
MVSEGVKARGGQTSGQKGRPGKRRRGGAGLMRGGFSMWKKL